MSMSMSSIVPDYRSPLTIFYKLTFQLHNKPKDLAAFRLEHHAQSIVIIQ